SSVSAWPNPSHMSSDMALRFSGLLKVTMPTPSATPLRILPSAKDFSSLLGTSSIGEAFLLKKMDQDVRNGPKFARAKAGRACILTHHSATRGWFFWDT